MLYFVLYIDGKQFAGELQIIGYNGERKNINSIAIIGGHLLCFSMRYRCSRCEKAL